MKKLVLHEDFEDNVINTEEVTSNEEDTNLIVSNLISTLIKAEWDIVDLYNSMLITIQDRKVDDVIQIFENNISDHYIHIGQLEKLLQSFNTYADDIDDGKESVEDVLTEN